MQPEKGSEGPHAPSAGGARHRYSSGYHSVELGGSPLRASSLPYAMPGVIVLMESAWFPEPAGHVCLRPSVYSLRSDRWSVGPLRRHALPVRADARELVTAVAHERDTSVTTNQQGSPPDKTAPFQPKLPASGYEALANREGIHSLPGSIFPYARGLPSASPLIHNISTPPLVPQW